ncbi:MAG: DUF5131 family protein [Roseofilum sp. SID3]|uniref:DUF5131 family protein n=1 Tax=Roseofilum sp. SID3 TaxID=2821499 RepID=UPI001B172C53|nr:DUF5131 family protein [Roseofilum sp. SID3]
MSKIEWTDITYNPIVGCSRVPRSPGCQNCYAATAAKSARLQQFERYQKVAAWNGTVEFVESALYNPLKWKKPRKIFTCSMSDLFHENIPDNWRHKIFAVMTLATQHTFQILTKRPENMNRYFESDRRPFTSIMLILPKKWECLLSTLTFCQQKTFGLE